MPTNKGPSLAVEELLGEERGSVLRPLRLASLFDTKLNIRFVETRESILLCEGAEAAADLPVARPSGRSSALLRKTC